MKKSELKLYYSIAVGITAINGLGFLSDDLVEKLFRLFECAEEDNDWLKPKVINVLKESIEYVKTIDATEAEETVIVLDLIVKKLEKVK